MQTAIKGAAVEIVPGFQVPDSVIIGKGIGDASLNTSNIIILHNGGKADDLLPSSVISLGTSGVGEVIDVITDDKYNASGKGEVVGDIVDLGFAVATGNVGTGANKFMNLGVAVVDIANSITEEW